MLASMLMESAFGVPNVPNDMLATYTHEDGANMIAMETAADVHDIFMEGFYGMEELEFMQCRAAMEGASEDVMGGIGRELGDKAKSVFNKIKTKLKELWEKIKAFAHNVKRYFLAIFQNGADFAKKYEKELKALNLKGFEVKVFDYSDLDTTYTTIQKFIDDVSGRAQKFIDGSSRDTGNEARDKTQNTMYIPGQFDKVIEDIYTAPLKANFGIEKKEELADKVYSMCRKGATSKDDKNAITVSKLDKYVDVLKGSKSTVSNIDKYARTTDNNFKNMINAVERIESSLKGGDTSNTSTHLSSLTSKCRIATTAFQNGQSSATTALNIYKTAVKEMLSAYKGICIKALGPGKTEKDKKK